MKKTLLAISVGVVSAAVLTTQIAGPLVAQQAESDSSVYEQLELFGDVFERVRLEYVEEVDDKALIESAIDGMLRSLDPHSFFNNAKETAELRIDTQGTFGGLGIEVTQEDGWVKVVSPIDGTPAEEAGVGRAIATPVAGVSQSPARRVQRSRRQAASETPLTYNYLGS
ncbi:MAG: hypothetical protein QGI70_11245, partial [Paracoccaceae bacterium]|nr:hypothetical protein [Paracoccaceae bacterium]